MNRVERACKPDFFIVGTMKGGTSMLYDFICSHPAVLRAKQKEIHYFSLYPDMGDDWYLSHFDFSKGKLTGEASPSYFDVAYTAAIPRWIKAFNPKAKIILITRDPVERAVSHFNHLKNINKIPSLQDMDPNDFFSRSYQSSLSQTSSIDYYLQRVLYSSCYSRKFLYYKDVFGADNILVLDYDELRLRSHATMKRVFDFLRLPFFEGESFDTTKYSSEQGSSVLTSKVRQKLSSFLCDDYRVFCQASGLRPSSVGDNSVYIENDVLVGEDGWLFLTGGSNTPLDYYRNNKEFSRSLVNDWCNLLLERQTKLMGIDYIHLFAPNKESVYDNKLGNYFVDFPGNPLAVLYRDASPAQAKLLADVAVNPISHFKKIRADYELYWKTDSHWSPAGCLVAYQLICSKLKVKPLVDLLSRSYTEGLAVMDLGVKFSPEIKEYVRFYNFCKSSFRAESNELVDFKERNGLENSPGLHVGSRVKFLNPEAICKKKVVIFGDSFSEYRSSLLTGMLAETFSEVNFVWSTSLDYKFIGEISPDIVISEIAERFMPMVPKDEFDVEGFPSQCIEKFRRANN